MSARCVAFVETLASYAGTAQADRARAGLEDPVESDTPLTIATGRLCAASGGFFAIPVVTGSQLPWVP